MTLRLSLLFLFGIVAILAPPSGALAAGPNCFEDPKGERFSPIPGYPLNNEFFIIKKGQPHFRIILRPAGPGQCDIRRTQNVTHVSREGDYWCQGDRVILTTDYGAKVLCTMTVIKCSLSPGSC